ncbi:hypothetical protein NDU88_008695 [Pleurodeles waltl]|uniref:Uncharacterized protein n=1 Tax=Pleurodeles waltl TaxID=8319 RepID=A0AAV7PST4_PLEWA|nr:hypothetical protein NDU88_008695 [Pleurodeles waltl]
MWVIIAEAEFCGCGGVLVVFCTAYQPRTEKRSSGAGSEWGRVWQSRRCPSPPDRARPFPGAEACKLEGANSGVACRTAASLYQRTAWSAAAGGSALQSEAATGGTVGGPLNVALHARRGKEAARDRKGALWGASIAIRFTKMLRL